MGHSVPGSYGCVNSKVEFYNEQVGLARTFFGPMEGVRTEDGGLSWEVVPGVHNYESFDFLTEDVILWGDQSLEKSLAEPWEYTLDGPPVTSLYMFNIDVVDQDTAYIATGISLWKYMGMIRLCFLMISAVETYFPPQQGLATIQM